MTFQPSWLERSSPPRATFWTPTQSLCRGRPKIVWWAWVGAVFAAIEAYTLISWGVSGNATPTHTNAALVPLHVKVSAIIIQCICMLVFAGVIVHVVRGCRRARTLTFDAVLTIAATTMFWLDPMFTYIIPQGFYNSYYINLGSWTSNVPGWISPNGHLLPEGLLVEGPIYGSILLLAMMVGAVMRRAERRWPDMGRAGLIAVGFGTMMLFDFVLEIAINVPSQAYAYGSTISWLTVFGDKVYRFPVYEAVCGSFVFAPAGILRYFRDKQGRSVVEQGIDRVPGPPARRQAYRVLAVIGILQLCFVCGYIIPVNFIGLHANRSYPLPSYLTNGVCGPGTSYKCPTPHGPILTSR